MHRSKKWKLQVLWTVTKRRQSKSNRFEKLYKWMLTFGTNHLQPRIWSAAEVQVAYKLQFYWLQRPLIIVISSFDWSSFQFLLQKAPRGSSHLDYSLLQSQSTMTFILLRSLAPPSLVTVIFPISINRCLGQYKNNVYFFWPDFWSCLISKNLHKYIPACLEFEPILVMNDVPRLYLCGIPGHCVWDILHLSLLVQIVFKVVYILCTQAASSTAVSVVPVWPHNRKHTSYFNNSRK